MNIREALLKEHSKKQTLLIAAYIGNDGKKFSILISLVLAGEEIVSQRAAWVLGTCADSHPDLVKPYLGRLAGMLDKKVHDAVRRNIIRVLQNQEIPLRLQGRLVETLFALLQSHEEPVAIKAFSMTVLLNLCKKHPALKHELSLVIESLVPFASAGLRSRAKNVLKELNRL